MKVKSLHFESFFCSLNNCTSIFAFFLYTYILFDSPTQELDSNLIQLKEKQENENRTNEQTIRQKDEAIEVSSSNGYLLLMTC